MAENDVITTMEFFGAAAKKSKQRSINQSPNSKLYILIEAKFSFRDCLLNALIIVEYEWYLQNKSTSSEKPKLQSIY